MLEICTFTFFFYFYAKFILEIIFLLKFENTAEMFLDTLVITVCYFLFHFKGTLYIHIQMYVCEQIGYWLRRIQPLVVNNLKNIRISKSTVRR